MTDKEIILQFLTTVKDEIKSRIKSTTNKTSDSLEVVMLGETHGQLLAADYIMALEHGRAPTRSGASSGSPTLRERIYAWAKINGIGSSEKELTSLSWAISKSIHTKGTLLYRTGGHSGIIFKSFNESRISDLLKTFAGKYQAIFETKVQFK